MLWIQKLWFKRILHSNIWWNIWRKKNEYSHMPTYHPFFSCRVLSNGRSNTVGVFHVLEGKICAHLGSAASWEKLVHAAADEQAVSNFYHHLRFLECSVWLETCHPCFVYWVCFNLAVLCLLASMLSEFRVSFCNNQCWPPSFVPANLWMDR